ncbi:MAG: hypothetical protein WBW33_18830, partial [Bryobacteraceae bacterium]
VLGRCAQHPNPIRASPPCEVRAAIFTTSSGEKRCPLPRSLPPTNLNAQLSSGPKTPEGKAKLF